MLKNKTKNLYKMLKSSHFNQNYDELLAVNNNIIEKQFFSFNTEL